MTCFENLVALVKMADQQRKRGIVLLPVLLDRSSVGISVAVHAAVRAGVVHADVRAGRQSHCARGDFFDFGTFSRQPVAASSTERVMQPDVSAPKRASEASSQQVRMGIPYRAPIFTKA